MTAQLWLLRHGEAVPHESKPDDDRELTPRGERQAAAAGAGLAALGLEFVACYTSPKVRARETARLACAALNIEPELLQALSGGFDRDDALKLFDGREEDARILVVGHDPDFTDLVHEFTGGRIDFKKGGVAGMSVASDGAQLLVLLRPRELESLAARG